jgi:hypothetical protein
VNNSRDYPVDKCSTIQYKAGMNALLPTPETLTLAQVLAKFNTEEKAVKYLEVIMWPDGPVCPHCQNKDASRMWKIKASAKKVRVGLRQCAECLKQFRVTVGTIFEDSHIPLNLWVVAWYLMCGSKKGMSALQMQRHLGLGSYKSAWFMCHRIRHAMQDIMSPKEKMTGTVEVDECYVGPKGTAEKPRRKSAVIALVNRATGERRSIIMERVSAKDLKVAVAAHVAAGATVNTDESLLYRNIPEGFKHKTNYHAPIKGKPRYHFTDKEGDVCTTNYAESSFSLLRRGVVGSFHHISRKHLGLYVGEFDFRWNHRDTTDGERAVAGIERAAGKRMTYKPLVSAEAPSDAPIAPYRPKTKRGAYGPKGRRMKRK